MNVLQRLKGVTGRIPPTLIYLAASAVSRLGAIVLVPLYARKLTKGEYGDYSLALSVVSLAPAVFTLGLNTAVPRAFFGEKDRTKAAQAAGDVALWGLLAATVITACVALLVELLPGRYWSEGLLTRRNLHLLLVAGLGSTVANVPAVALRAASRPVAASAFQLLEFFSVAGIGVLVVGPLGRGFPGAVEALTYAYVLTGGVSILYILLGMKGRLRRGAVRRSLAFGVPFVPHFLASWLQSVGDRWILKFAGFDGALGSYALASQVSSPVPMVVAAWNDTASPRIGEAFRDGGLAGLRDVMVPMMRRYLVSALLPCIVVVLAMPLLPFIVGAGFRDLLWMVPVFLLIHVVDTQYFPTQAVVYFADRTRVIPIITVATAIVTVLLNVLLVPRFGAGGALVARLLTLAGRSIAMWGVARRIVASAKASS